MHRLPFNPITRADYLRKEPHSIAVVGHLAVDTILHPNLKIPSSSGGSAAAIATAAVQLGIYTSIYSNVGKDFPKEWLSALENLRIDISNIKISEKEKTLNFTFKYDESGEIKTIKCNDRKLTQLKIKTIPKTECVHLCPMLPEDHIQLIQNMKDNCDILSISFSEYFSKDYEKKDFLGNVDWNAIDIVFANENEGRAITKYKRPDKIASKFHDLGAGIVVITLGKKGSLVFDGENKHKIESMNVKVLDPTGCKDSYIGGFLGEYLISKNVRKAAGTGTYIASLTAQKKGSWAALLSDAGVRF